MCKSDDYVSCIPKLRTEIARAGLIPSPKRDYLFDLSGHPKINWRFDELG
jgi:hypothetical protein